MLFSNLVTFTNLCFSGMTRVPTARLFDFTRSASLDESDLLSHAHWSNASIHITENPISEAVVC